MEERETQAREGAGDRAFTRARWLLPVSVSAAAAVVAVMAAPAGGGSAVNARHGADVTVEARDNVFAASTVTISPGETVTWTQAGSNPHNVRFDNGSFEQPTAPTSSPWTVSRTFQEPNVSYAYYCEAHGGPGGAGMAGTVTVTGAAPPPGTPPPGGGTPPPGGGTPPPGGGGGNPPPGGGGGGGGGDQPGGGGGGGGGAPGGRADTTVTLKVSDASPARGARVRFFGTVQPEQDGRMLQLQRRRGRSYVTITRVRLTDAGSARSKFSKRLRIVGDAVFRARLPADSDHLTGVSRTRRLNVP
jgi:plastocyanin